MLFICVLYNNNATVLYQGFLCIIDNLTLIWEGLPGVGGVARSVEGGDDEDIHYSDALGIGS